jgi:hypothetical protein
MGLRYALKIHALPIHALRQIRKIGGFGDLLEDDAENSHQDEDKFDQRPGDYALHTSLATRRQQTMWRSLLLRKQ